MNPGFRVGPYAILRQLGAGGMGTVWLAEDTRLGRQVALKSLRGAAEDTSGRASLMREARAAAALNHPHIAAVHDVLESDGQVIIVFEYVEGESLASRLDRGPLTIADAVEMGHQLADALAAAHASGIVHRDLKPGNVIVGADGRLKVLDFGIARLMPGDTTTGAGGPPTTGAGLVGTPGYAAPEQWLSHDVDARADLYALGVVLYEMVRGERPFRTTDPVVLAGKTLQDEAPRLSSGGLVVPVPLDMLVSQLLSRHPAERPASARVVREALQALKQETRRLLPPAPSPRPLSAAALVASATAAIAIPGLVGWLWMRPAPPPAPVASPVVAVLPLANMSGDSSKDYIAAGVADSLITSLAALPAITVLSRAAVTEARARVPELAALARDLSATYLVEGSVQQVADRLKVSLTLVKAADRSIAWGDTVEGEFAQIFTMQTRLATALGSALAVRVSPDERRRLQSAPTTNANALAAYWRGRALLERSDVKGNTEAGCNAFREALVGDAKFALAHAGLGQCYWRHYQESRDASWVEKAIEASTTALRLDPDQPEVRYTLAVTLVGGGRLEEATEELQKALALRPNYEEARRQLGGVLAQQGHIDQAIAEFRKAIALRPTSPLTFSSLGFRLMGAARYKEAAEAFERMTILQPDNYSGFQQLGTAYQMLGDNQRAIENYRKATSIRPNPQSLSNMGAIFHQQGRYAEAVESYAAAVALRPNAPATHRNLGDAYVKLNRAQEAHTSYREAVRLAEAELKVNPNDPRIVAALAVYLQKAGSDAEAVMRIDQALAKAPDLPEVQFRAAVVHALAGRDDAAMDRLQAALRLGYSRASVAEADELSRLQRLPRYKSLMSAQPQGAPP